MNDQEKDRLFGEIGIDLGLISLNDMEIALKEQKVDEAIGVCKPVGAYLFANEKLTKAQIGQIVAMQEKFLAKHQTKSISNKPNIKRDFFYEPRLQIFIYHVFIGSIFDSSTRLFTRRSRSHEI